MAEEKTGNSSVWKKLSTNSKSRSYRDGKPRDDRLLFREREVVKKSERSSRHERSVRSDSKKDSSCRGHRAYPGDDFKSDRYRRHESESRQEKNGDSKRNKRSKKDVYEEYKDSRKSKRRKCKHHRQVEEEGKPDQLAEANNREKLKKQQHHSHHHRHHRHHKKCKHRQQDEKSSPKRTSMDLEHHNEHRNSPSRMQKPSERLKTNPHKEITPLDSKEIYAEGDKIIVNVSFSKAMPEKKDSKDEAKSSKDTGDQLLSASLPEFAVNSKPGEPPKKDVKLVSKSKTEFDIFWDDSSNDKEMPPDDSCLPCDNAKPSPVSELYTSGSPPLKKDNSETRFVPRTLLTDVKHSVTAEKLPEMPLAATPPETPPPNCEESKLLNVSSPDQTMPTPTQDESHHDSKDGSYPSLDSNSIKSPASPVNTHSNEKTKSQDIYDPEAPLESPDEEFVVDVKKNVPVSESSSSRLNRSPIPEPCSPEGPEPELEIKASPVIPNKNSIKPARSPPVSTFSNQSTPLTMSASSGHLNNLVRLMPSSAASAAPAPNSLLAQIQKTLSQHQKSTPQQQQQLHQLLHTASSITSMLKNSVNTNHNSQSSAKSHVNQVKDKDVDSPHSPIPPVGNSGVNNTRVTLGSLQSSSNPALKSVIDQLLRAAQSKPKNSSQKPTVAPPTNPGTTFKRPMPVALRDSSATKPKSELSLVTSSYAGKSNSKHQLHAHHASVKTKVTIPAEKPAIKKPTPGSCVSNSSGAVNIKLKDVAVLDDLPSSAVELQVKEKYLKKLNRQERVVEEVKLVLKPYYQRREVTKEEYKEILRKSVPKICHSKTGEINPVKIKLLVEEYIKRVKHLRKKTKTKGKNLVGALKL